jgi:hypothetical protein
MFSLPLSFCSSCCYARAITHSKKRITYRITQSVYELLLLGGWRSTRHIHKAREDLIFRHSSRPMNMGGLALLLLVCMAMALQYVIIASSIMEVSLLLWLSFTSFLLLFCPLFVCCYLSQICCCLSIVVVCCYFV